MLDNNGGIGPYSLRFTNRYQLIWYKAQTTTISNTTAAETKRAASIIARIKRI